MTRAAGVEHAVMPESLRLDCLLILVVLLNAHLVLDGRKNIFGALLNVARLRVGREARSAAAENFGHL